MLVGMYKWFKHWLVWLLLGVFLVSLCFAHWHTGVNPHSSFYYLWHFPIFAFTRNFQTDISVYDKLAWIALTFALSIFSYRFIEKPFRNRQTISMRQFWGVTAGISLLIVVFSLYVIQDNGSRHRFSNLELLYGVNEFDTRILKNRSYDVLGALAEEEGFAPSLPLEPSEYESTKLWFSSNTETHKVLIVGVSSSMDLFNAFYLNAESFPGYEFARDTARR